MKRRKQHGNGDKELMSDRRTGGFCSLPSIMKVIKLRMLPSMGHLKYMENFRNVYDIHSFSIVSDDRFKASSKTIPPHSAI